MDTRHPSDRSGLFSDPDDIWYFVDYEPMFPTEPQEPEPWTDQDETDQDEEELPF